MITRIRLRNFQSHSSLELELDDRVTTIIGKTDAGKSALVRALKWVAFNRPSGEAFIRSGSDWTSVKIKTSEGHVVTRRKGKENLYKIDDQSLRAFGTGVPEPVQAVLNLNEINFQEQHDAPFWLTLSPGQLSRELNSIVDLSVIDKTLKTLNSRVKQSKAKIKFTEERLDQAEAAVADLAWAEEADRDLRKVEEKERVLEDLSHQIESLQPLIKQVQDIETSLARLSHAATGASKSFKTLLQRREAKDRAVQRCDRLMTIISTGASLKEQICRTESQLAEAVKAKAKIKRCPMCQQAIPQP